jgi:tRNA(Glu) U13 pseudouridine synthase TruD
VNGQLVHERYDRRGRSGEVMVLAGNRFAVTVRGSGVEAETLTATLQRIDTNKLAALAAAAQ